MTTDLAQVVSVTYDVQEVDFVTQFHGAKCPGLTNATEYCNFVADGANLCAEAHSKQWWNFVHCMYKFVDPNGDQEGDVGNPLAHVESFDASLTKCATETLKDYTVEHLRECVYGQEAVDLRKVSAAKTAADLAAGKPPVVWIDVNGTFVQAPEAKNNTRSAWKKELRSAICSSLYIHTSDPTVKPIWDKECATTVVV